MIQTLNKRKKTGEFRDLEAVTSLGEFPEKAFDDSRSRLLTCGQSLLSQLPSKSLSAIPFALKDVLILSNRDIIFCPDVSEKSKEVSQSQDSCPKSGISFFHSTDR